MDLLIQRGANVNAANSKNNTPLIAAVKNGEKTTNPPSVGGIIYTSYSLQDTQKLWIRSLEQEPT